MNTIPGHVIRPIHDEYLPTNKYPLMNSSSLGYALLRALGAHEQLSDESIHVVIQWTNSMHTKTGGLTPLTDRLKTVSEHKPLVECVRERLSPKYKADITCLNAATFCGDKRRPSYESLYIDVWVNRKWPELCHALSYGSTAESVDGYQELRA